MMRTIAAAVLSFVSMALLSGQAAKPAAQAAAQAAAHESGPLQVRTLLQTDKAWDGTAYDSYPAGRPQLSVLEITIPPHTTMDWHRHPVPNAAYVVGGELKVESQGGKVTNFTKGQVVPETVGVWHRGVTGEKAAELLVFYAGAPGVPLSEPQPKTPAK